MLGGFLALCAVDLVLQLLCRMELVEAALQGDNLVFIVVVLDLL